jgi:hypothetical protein
MNQERIILCHRSCNAAIKVENGVTVAIMLCHISHNNPASEPVKTHDLVLVASLARRARNHPKRGKILIRGIK